MNIKYKKNNFKVRKFKSFRKENYYGRKNSRNSSKGIRAENC